MKGYKMEYTIKWEVTDGYAGKSRPQETKVDILDHMDSEEWENLSKDEKAEFIFDIVQEDFESKISFSVENLDELLIDEGESYEEDESY